MLQFFIDCAVKNPVFCNHPPIWSVSRNRDQQSDVDNSASIQR